MYRVIRGQEDLRTRSNREAQVCEEQLAEPERRRRMIRQGRK